MRLLLLASLLSGCVWMRTPVAEGALCPWDRQNDAFREVIDCPSDDPDREVWLGEAWGCHQAEQLDLYLDALGLECPEPEGP
jgi:hypothetical protein